MIGDLGEERQAEDALRASEQLHRSIVETLDEGVMVQDLDGRVIAFNKSALHILGLEAERLPDGSSYKPLVPLIHEDGSPFEGHEHPSMVSLRTGEPQNGVIMGVQTAGETRWISINSRALCRPGEPTPYAAVGSFSDITAYRHTLTELHSARLEDLERLALVGEYRDDDTNRHTERVAHTAALLARELELEGELVWTIRRAAPLHDVGKIGISDTILLKPGRLTREEFETMKAHTLIGGRILGESDFRILQMATEIALTHHEHWDGSGYPQGLAGGAIPIVGRITAVADAFDAMTHARPYKEAFPVAQAVAEIERCSGSQFDPRIVKAFMALEHGTLVDEVRHNGHRARDAS
jgi:putative two-component system response regulator